LKCFPIYHSPVFLPLDATMKKLRQRQWYFEFKEKILETSPKGNLTPTEKCTYDLPKKKYHVLTLCTFCVSQEDTREWLYAHAV